MILTDQECRDTYNAAMGAPDRSTVAVSRAIETAVIRKLAAGVPSNSNGGMTGWPPGLLQDDCRALSNWLSSRPDCMYRLRELYASQAAAEPVAWFIDVTTNGKSTGDYQVAAREHWGDKSICIPLYTSPPDHATIATLKKSTKTLAVGPTTYMREGGL